MRNTIWYILASCVAVVLLLFVFKIANPNPIRSVGLLFRGRDDVAGQERMTIELVSKRDGRENINSLKIIAPRGLQIAWTMNKKSAHGIIA